MLSFVLLGSKPVFQPLSKKNQVYLSRDQHIHQHQNDINMSCANLWPHLKSGTYLRSHVQYAVSSKSVWVLVETKWCLHIAIAPMSLNWKFRLKCDSQWTQGQYLWFMTDWKSRYINIVHKKVTVCVGVCLSLCMSRHAHVVKSCFEIYVD